MSGYPVRPAVFLDRDGTILVEKNYLADPDEVELIPGAMDGLRRLRDAGFTLVVVTNQSGIARGLYDEADYHAVDARMRALLADADIAIAASYHCPHHPDFSGPCDCRKPGLELFQRAIRDLGLDPSRSWLVGDRLRDVEPARALGARGVLVRTGYGAEEASLAPAGLPVAYDLNAAAALIVAA
jgi:D-glycero-D-manno-heptose 1,7-bisphosphate phosphatase